MICTQRTEGLWATPNLLHTLIKEAYSKCGSPRNAIKECFMEAMLVGKASWFCEKDAVSGEDL